MFSEFSSNFVISTIYWSIDVFSRKGEGSAIRYCIVALQPSPVRGEGLRSPAQHGFDSERLRRSASYGRDRRKAATSLCILGGRDGAKRTNSESSRAFIGPDRSEPKS